MKITIIAAGRVKDKYLRDGIDDYVKRLARFAKIKIIETAEEKMSDSPSPAEKQQTLSREGKRLLASVPRGSFLFVLDVAGDMLSSEELAAKINDITLTGRSDMAFIIGGTFGLSDEVRRAADMRLGFSRMTFTHQMIRLLLTEQLYRAFKINGGEKYHW